MSMHRVNCKPIWGHAEVKSLLELLKLSYCEDDMFGKRSVGGVHKIISYSFYKLVVSVEVLLFFILLLLSTDNTSTSMLILLLC